MSSKSWSRSRALSLNNFCCTSISLAMWPKALSRSMGSWSPLSMGKSVFNEKKLGSDPLMSESMEDCLMSTVEASNWGKFSFRDWMVELCFWIDGCSGWNFWSLVRLLGFSGKRPGEAEIDVCSLRRGLLLLLLRPLGTCPGCINVLDGRIEAAEAMRMALWGATLKIPPSAGLSV